MWSSYYSSLEEKSGLNNARKGFGVLPTWPANMPFINIPIDHCLVSKEFNVENAEIGSDIGSDHYPLVISVSFK
jgi:endonuclease/exonuclease/phosphatase (EEP) superfamily protein YafD